MALAPIWLWRPEPDLHPTMSPGPWVAQPQLQALPLQLQGSARPSHAPRLAQVGTPSRSSSVTPPSGACLGWRPLLLLPNSGNMRWHCIHPQPRARLYTCWTCPAAQYSSDTTMSTLWHRQASGASHDCAWAVCHRSASAALGEGYWDLRGYLVTMGTLKHLPPGGTGSGFRA